MGGALRISKFKGGGNILPWSSFDIFFLEEYSRMTTPPTKGDQGKILPQFSQMSAFGFPILTLEFLKIFFK
jgi:hypothetical protein